MKTLYLIRHSGPFIDIYNYEDYKNVNWDDYNRNMILSPEGEENARKLCELDELKDIDEIYSSDSFRAIGTAKYIAEKNNLKIKLDSRINERNLGISKINDMPSDFSFSSFFDKDLKMPNGESLNEVDVRFKSFLNEILNGESERIILSIHGMILLSYLQNYCDFKYDDKIFDIKFNGKQVLNGRLKNPHVFKLVYDNDNSIISIDNLSLVI